MSTHHIAKVGRTWELREDATGDLVGIIEFHSVWNEDLRRLFFADGDATAGAYDAGGMQVTATGSPHAIVQDLDRDLVASHQAEIQAGDPGDWHLANMLQYRLSLDSNHDWLLSYRYAGPIKTYPFEALWGYDLANVPFPDSDLQFVGFDANDPAYDLVIVTWKTATPA